MLDVNEAGRLRRHLERERLAQGHCWLLVAPIRQGGWSGGRSRPWGGLHSARDIGGAGSVPLGRICRRHCSIGCGPKAGRQWWPTAFGRSSTFAALARLPIEIRQRLTAFETDRGCGRPGVPPRVGRGAELARRTTVRPLVARWPELFVAVGFETIADAAGRNRAPLPLLQRRSRPHRSRHAMLLQLEECRKIRSSTTTRSRSSRWRLLRLSECAGARQGCAVARYAPAGLDGGRAERRSLRRIRRRGLPTRSRLPGCGTSSESGGAFGGPR